jgi:hypothetical protein
MPEVQEVFRMATQKVRPDPDSLEQQHRDQRRHASRQKATVFVLVGALVLGGAGFAITQLGSDGTGEPLGSPTASPPPTTASSLPTVGNGVALEPGRYVISTSDQAFNASHQITIDVPAGYSGWEGVAVFKDQTDGGETGVATWVVDDVFTDACEWRGTESAISSADDLAAALAAQDALSPSTPIHDEVDGFRGWQMKLTTPSLAKVNRCDGARFAVWMEPGGGSRYLNNPGETEDLWILDVDGAVLVINAPIGPDAPFRDRAEVLVQMLQSIRIDRK